MSLRYFSSCFTLALVAMGRGVKRERAPGVLDDERFGFGKPPKTVGFSMKRTVGDGPIFGDLLLLY